MHIIQNIAIDSYDYDLPDDRIAKFPLPERDASKLLVYKEGRISEDRFDALSRHLSEDSLLVFNDTKVIQARIVFRKDSGARVELLCLEPQDPVDYERNFAQTSCCSWLCMVGNAKRWKTGELRKQVTSGKGGFTLFAEKTGSVGEQALIRFSWDRPELTFADILDRCGELPIPPYLKRDSEESDKITYQTIYSQVKGSIAAPTAGLHFTEKVFDSLRAKRIQLEKLTLHVGAGTFRPVKSETIADHVMHSEWFTVKKSTIERLLQGQRMVIAVGTTSVRTLESLYYIGVQLGKDPEALPERLEVDQWMPYVEEHNRLPVATALQNVLNYMEKRHLSSLTTRTQILIAPGYTFKIVKGIITNFHQPKSTLLLLISAFLGEPWQRVYTFALENGFRFLSYGDSSLLLPDTV